MRVAEYMMAPASSVSPEDTVREAARRMREEGVGCLPVTGADGTLRGVVTDRDLAVRCLAGDADPEAPVVRAMSARVVTVDAAADVAAAYRAFRRSGVRRLPVVEQGRLVGVLAVDDLLLDVFQHFADLLGPVAWSVLRDPPGPGVPGVGPGFRVEGA